MALRYLARTAGIRDLQRAQGHLPYTTAGSRPLNSRSPLVGQNNGGVDRKLDIELTARLHDTLSAGREAIKEFERREKIRKIWLRVCGAVGVGLAVVVAAADVDRDGETRFIRRV